MSGVQNFSFSNMAQLSDHFIKAQKTDQKESDAENKEHSLTPVTIKQLTTGEDEFDLVSICGRVLRHKTSAGQIEMVINDLTGSLSVSFFITDKFSRESWELIEKLEYVV